jgi:hypothetical protein
MITDPIEKFERYTKDTNDFMNTKSQTVFAQYPLVFSFLILFGSIATLKGFESIIFQIPLFNEYPVLLFIIGILILLFTGRLYKTLQKNK